MHITQRGVDRNATFLAEDDYAFYLWGLRAASLAAGCVVHAYVLMTNHVHLLLTPADITGPARMMRSLGPCYVRYFNQRYGRTGTLWEGRYRSTVVDSAEYFFGCSRYIESNPLRAGLVRNLDDYAWSSYHHNARGASDALVAPHARYLALGAGPQARHAAYRALFAEELTAPTAAAIRTAAPGTSSLARSAYRQAVDALGRERKTVSALALTRSPKSHAQPLG